MSDHRISIHGGWSLWKEVCLRGAGFPAAPVAALSSPEAARAVDAWSHAKKTFEAAQEKVEDEEDEHLYHTAGWARELWIEFLGMPAVMPPPEEEKDVKTAIGAARAKQARAEML